MKQSNKTGIIMGITCTALALSALLIVLLLVESKRIHDFKIDVFVLCQESDICVAEGPDGTIKVHSENLPALYSIMQKSHGRMVTSTPEARKSLSLSFSCHEEDWTMTIDEINEEMLRISLSGPKNKTMYFNNNGAYAEYEKAVSLAGANVHNKKIGG